MIPTLLELVGFACLVAFAFVVWPPAALATAGVLCIGGALAIEGQAKRNRKS